MQRSIKERNCVLVSVIKRVGLLALAEVSCKDRAPTTSSGVLPSSEAVAMMPGDESVVKCDSEKSHGQTAAIESVPPFATVRR